ncbi:IS5 family transposase [Amycolatopsis sp. YIM 10]|uniref:IS5 family transposase n=1 Tax=Amycolatopsis sp. YIM 10 TaxID=2653857 RepID=UPI00351A4365
MCGRISTRRVPGKRGCADWIEALAIDGECLGRSRGGLTTKLHLAVDGAGLPLAVILTPGRAGDNPQLLPLLDDIRDLEVGGQRVRVGRVLADKAYTHPSTRKALRERRIKATIPERADQIARRKARGSAGGRPPDFDPGLYTLRNVVERCFNRLKQFRGLATRYAKRAAYHRAEIVLACIVLHLR